MRLLHLVLACALSVSCAAVPARTTEAAPSSAEGPDARLQVGFVIVDGVYNTELTAPFDIFQHSVFHTDPGMRVFTVAPGTGPITTFEGLRILPDYGFEAAPKIDVLVVPSAEHSMDSDLEDELLMDFVRTRGGRANYVISLCDGAFVLAAAGLLDGHQATTFPADIDRFRERFPEIDVIDDVSFVHDRKAITSAGGALSFDPALYLAQLLYGAKAARGMARGLCIDWDVARVEHRVSGD